jgi:hypothetical protein
MRGMRKSEKLSRMMIEIGGRVQQDRNPGKAKESWVEPVCQSKDRRDR